MTDPNLGPGGVGGPELVVFASEDAFLKQFLRDCPWSLGDASVPPPWYWRLLHGYEADDYDGTPGRKAIVLENGYQGDARRVAHEYGHFLGLMHPPWLSWAMLLDTMGLGLRVRDEHGLLAASAEWRKQHGLP